MKRKTLFTIFLLLISLCFASAASATNHIWVSPDYSFRGCDKVFLKNLDTSKAKISSVMEKTTNSLYLKMASENLKVPSLIEGAANVETAKLTVEAVLSDCHSESVFHPAWTEWVSERRTRTIHRDGKTYEEEWYETVPKFHASYYETTYYVNMQFKVYDTATQKVVLEKEDYRSRTTDDPTGMIERISKAFFKDLSKQIKGDD